MEVKAEEGKGSGKGKGKGKVGNNEMVLKLKGKVGNNEVVLKRKGGMVYPCKECGMELEHWRMIKSSRPAHVEVKEMAAEEFEGKKVHKEVSYKICADCEANLRVQEAKLQGEDLQKGLVVQAALKEIHRTYKGEAWATRASHYYLAIEEVENDPENQKLSHKQKSRLKTEKAKQMTKDFLEALKSGGLLSVFAGAGNRMKACVPQFQEVARLNKLLETPELSPEDRSKLEEQLHDAEADFESAHLYETFADKEDQDDWLRAIDYEDRMTVDGSMKRFYRCNCCGTYFSSKFWTYNKVARKWYCRLDWMAFLQKADKATRAAVVDTYGDDPRRYPEVGCGKLYKPWSNGEGCLIEYKDGQDQWRCFVSDLFPEMLDDAIKKHQAEFLEAFKRTTAEELEEIIPVTFPSMNPVCLGKFQKIPGVGQFTNKDATVVSTADWCRLCMKVAEKSEDSLDTLFSVAQTMANKATRRPGVEEKDL